MSGWFAKIGMNDYRTRGGKESRCNERTAISCVRSAAADQQQVEILKSTLFAIYTAEQKNIYDASTYMEAIHGSVQQAQKVLEELQKVLQLISEEEAGSMASIKSQ